MPEYNVGAQNARTASRIDNDVERIKTITTRVIAAREALVRHAHSLGYFSPPKDGSVAGGPTPVVANMTDAIAELDRESDHMLGALNLYQ